MARKFFFICAGLMFVAIAYHLGAKNATAQAPGSLVAMTAEVGPIFAVDQAGNIYSGEGCFGNLRPFARVGQLPGGVTPTCMASWNNGQDIFIGCSNGDVYSFAPFASPPITPGFCGNITGGAPTPATQETWGQLKSRYRPGAATQ